MVLLQRHRTWRPLSDASLAVSCMAHPRVSTPQALKRIETIEDDETEIVEAVRRMSARYDFVVTRHVASPLPRAR
jgi:hypothetical protein